MYHDYTQLLIEKQDKILIIKFNNPKKKNCLNLTSYGEITRALHEVAKDESVTIVVFTGTGDFFSAGNDLSQSDDSDTDMDARIKRINTTFKDMIKALIECPKIAIALVNGPAIGIGATLSGLCDLIWCSDTAYFWMPFTALGIVPEACSSYLLPLMIGRSRATEMLLFSERLTAAQALQCNFVSRVFANSELNTVIWAKIKQFSELPPNSMQISKRLICSYAKETLYKALDTESYELCQRFYSEEFMNALIEFSLRKNNSKL